jgi:hypothetical protein
VTKKISIKHLSVSLSLCTNKLECFSLVSFLSEVLLTKKNSLNISPGLEILKLFSLSLSICTNKLECLPLASFFVRSVTDKEKSLKKFLLVSTY